MQRSALLLESVSIGWLNRQDFKLLASASALSQIWPQPASTSISQHDDLTYHTNPRIHDSQAISWLQRPPSHITAIMPGVTVRDVDVSLAATQDREKTLRAAKMLWMKHQKMDEEGNDQRLTWDFHCRHKNS